MKLYRYYFIYINSYFFLTNTLRNSFHIWHTYYSDASAIRKKLFKGPLRHPDTGLIIVAAGYHWHKQGPFAFFVQLDANIAGYPEKFKDGPIRHPDTGLAAFLD